MFIFFKSFFEMIGKLGVFRLVFRVREEFRRVSIIVFNLYG